MKDSLIEQAKHCPGQVGWVSNINICIKNTQPRGEYIRYKIGTVEMQSKKYNTLNLVMN